MKILKELIPYIIIVIVVIIIRTFIVTPVRVNGSSMDPTLETNEILILKKYDRSYKRFDIVVLKYNNEKLVKRVIGLPDEVVEYKENKLYVDGELIEEEFLEKNVKTSDFDLILLGYEKIPNDYYLVLGDNREDSLDSRIIGLVSKEDILGTTTFSLFPFNKFGYINKKSK